MYGFDELLEGMTNAILKAREVSEQQHIEMLERFFEETADGQLSARSIKLVVPDLDGDGESEMEINLPLVTLVPVNSLELERVEIEFDAYLSMLGDQKRTILKKGKEVEEEKKHLQLELPGSGTFGQKKNNVKVKITMKGSEPPEGLVRINDRVLKSLP